MSRCTAKSKRTGEQCQRPACKGKRVCYHHGGAPGSGRPPSTFRGLLRYSEALETDPEGKALYERFRDDPALDELGNEVALVRAKLARYLKQQGQSLDEKTLANVLGFSEVIAKIVEKRHKIQYGEQYTITTRDWEVMSSRLFDLVREVYGDDARYDQFLERVGAVFGTGGGQAQAATR